MCLSLNYNREKGRIQERKKIIMKKYTPSDLLYYFVGEKKVLLYEFMRLLIDDHGAELVSIYANGTEYLWQAA